jgi:murein tripeptide amidase MpaA
MRVYENVIESNRRKEGKMTISTAHYYQNDEIDQLLDLWSAAYPSLIHLREIGKSYEGRTLRMAVLTNFATGDDLEKPAVWVDANIHATELAGATVALAAIERLLENYGKDTQITRLLDTSTYYILPRTNPDGAALAMGKNPRYVRSGTRPYPWQELDRGLHAQDVDGDGRILQMRIPDPNGNWKINTTNPRLMEMRQPNEQDGKYYRLLSEGLLEDYDGYVISEAKPLQSLDFNRNFPFDWKPENQQQGAGPYPTSEVEIRAVVDFVSKHPNINSALTYHTSSHVILRPFSTRPDDDFTYSDLLVYKKIAQIGTQLTGYPSVSIYHGFRWEPKEMTYGASDDWMYDYQGIFAYTVELWDLPIAAGIKDRKLVEWYTDHPVEDDLKVLKWVEENYPTGYMDWYSFDHPQLGKVELGGWDRLFTWTNPPEKLLAEEVKGQLPFILSLGDMLPHLSIYKLEVEKLREKVWRLNLVVENSGFLPTYTSQQGKTRQVARPVRVELVLPAGARLLSGKRRSELGHLEGRSNKLSDIILGSNPTDNRARSDWVIHSEVGGELVIHVLSERAGKLHQTIKLE